MANGAKVDASVLVNGLDVLNNVSKIAANVTSNKPAEKKTYNEGDSMNQPHNQTVEVKVGDQGQQKPVVVHEKKETHIHKPYPDGRNLTSEECEVEKLRIQAASEQSKAELDFRRWQAEEERKERREREEYARKERERKRQEDKKFLRRVGIFFGAVTVAGLSYAAYDYYTNTRTPGSTRLALPKSQASITIEAEGTVK